MAYYFHAGCSDAYECAPVASYKRENLPFAGALKEMWFSLGGSEKNVANSQPKAHVNYHAESASKLSRKIPSGGYVQFN